MWMLLIACLPLAAVLARAFPADVDSALAQAKNLYVASERADGSRSKVSPVWFMRDGDVLYFTTVPTSYKARRVALGRPLHVWVGREDGPYFKARGEVVRDPALAARMAPVYAEKYWIAWMGFFRPSPTRIQAGKSVIVKVVPWDDGSPS